MQSRSLRFCIISWGVHRIFWRVAASSVAVSGEAETGTRADRSLDEMVMSCDMLLDLGVPSDLGVIRVSRFFAVNLSRPR
jgi:hypothetical protein